MLRRAGCYQKRLAPYERGWIVVCRISASTVSIHHSGNVTKNTNNVQLLKPDVLADEPYLEFDAQEVDGIGGHNLRQRDNLRCPARYDD